MFWREQFVANFLGTEQHVASVSYSAICCPWTVQDISQLACRPTFRIVQHVAIFLGKCSMLPFFTVQHVANVLDSAQPCLPC
jgi:hypothetical protein